MISVKIFIKQGKGPDLIFLHGWKQDKNYWRPLISQLDQNFTCWLVDLPGFDLFGLINRHSPQGAEALCDLYLPAYFIGVGVKVDPENYQAMYFLYYLLERVIRKTYLSANFEAKNFINDFEKRFKPK